MTTTDDLALLWQDDGASVNIRAGVDHVGVDVLVSGARAQQRRRWLPFIFSSVVLAVAIAQHLTALRTSLLQAAPFVVVSGHALVMCAALAVVVAAMTQMLQQRSLATAVAGDDVVARAYSPLLASARRVQWATAALLLVAANIAFLSIVMSLIVGGNVAVIFVAIAIVASLGLASWKLEALSMSLSAAMTRRATSLRVEPLRPSLPSASSAPSSASSVSRTSTPSPSLLSIGDVPGSSAAMISSRHFTTSSSSLSGLSDRERRAWRAVVALVALAVVPLLIDAIAVLGLQWGPQPTAWGNGLTTFDVALLHRVLPYLPIAVALLASVVTPLAFVIGRDIVDRRFLGRFTWAALLPLLGLPAVLSALGLAVNDDLNAHLWGYSFSLQAVRNVINGTCGGECLFYFTATCIATLGRVLRFFAVVVVAVGLRRLVGPGALRRAVFAVLVLQAALWIATSWLASPDAWRGLIDVTAGVTLLLIAVLSQPAFETRGTPSSQQIR